MSIEASMKKIKEFTNLHRPDGRPDVFLFGTPRGGTTWLMELIATEPGFKCCDEPLDLRNLAVKKKLSSLGITEWEQFYDDAAASDLRQYFQGFIDGSTRFKNSSPLKRYYRPVTHRMVFKVIHGGEDRINWFRETFRCNVVYLVRHPISVSLSREQLPRLNAYVSSSYSRFFTQKQLGVAQAIIESGTHLEKAVLSWCFENAVPLRHMTDEWAVVTYEQLVTDPLPVIKELADKLKLSHPEKMRKALSIPSGSKSKSNEKTQELLRNGVDLDSRRKLVEKWTREVSEETEKKLMGIVEQFDIDVYELGEVLPNPKFLIKQSKSIGATL